MATEWPEFRQRLQQFADKNLLTYEIVREARTAQDGEDAAYFVEYCANAEQHRLFSKHLKASFNLSDSAVSKQLLKKPLEALDKRCADQIDSMVQRYVRSVFGAKLASEQQFFIIESNIAENTYVIYVHKLPAQPSEVLLRNTQKDLI